jgi:hypothetical protein
MSIGYAYADEIRIRRGVRATRLRRLADRFNGFLRPVRVSWLTNHSRLISRSDSIAFTTESTSIGLSGADSSVVKLTPAWRAWSITRAPKKPFESKRPLPSGSSARRRSPRSRRCRSR